MKYEERMSKHRERMSKHRERMSKHRERISKHRERKFFTRDVLFWRVVFNAMRTEAETKYLVQQLLISHAYTCHHDY